MPWVSVKFKIPGKRDDRQWKLVSSLIESGSRFFSYASRGRTIRYPKSKWEIPAFLSKVEESKTLTRHCAKCQGSLPRGETAADILRKQKIKPPKGYAKLCRFCAQLNQKLEIEELLSHKQKLPKRLRGIERLRTPKPAK